MDKVTVEKTTQGLSGRLEFPGDKSLSHRAIIFGALAEGESTFENILEGEDCVCTRKAFENMGVQIRRVAPGVLKIRGRGLRSLKKPSDPLYLGNSGTSMRLLLGIMAGQPFETVLTGDPSLSSRPMKRVTGFLRQMGAKIDGREDANLAPLTVRGVSPLKAIDAHLSVPSAQVKSALLLAGLYAEGATRVYEPAKSRDHTERFLSFFGADIFEKDLMVEVTGNKKMSAKNFSIPGDISSAAFFMAMALLVPGSKVEFHSLLDNPTRTGILEVLKRMGVSFGDWKGEPGGGPEPISNFSLKSQTLKAFEIHKQEMPSLIDELPILMVLATQAKGLSVIHDADELRVKETDRIHSMVTGLSKMGAKIRVEGNTIHIEGPCVLKGAEVDSFKDHRTAMSLIVAGLVAEGHTTVRDLDCIQTSFPNFFELLDRIR